jgi:glutamine amidotransferase
MITIIDYGVGNLSSIKNMLKRIGVAANITNNLAEIEVAEKLILPGVGHFNYGMQQLHKSNVMPILNQRVLQQKVPYWVFV